MVIVWFITLIYRLMTETFPPLPLDCGVRIHVSMIKEGKLCFFHGCNRTHLLGRAR